MPTTHVLRGAFAGALAIALAAGAGCSSNPAPRADRQNPSQRVPSHTPAASAPPLRAASAYAAEPIDVVERNRLREQAIAVLEEAALSTVPLLRANALEGLQDAPTRLEPLARSGLLDRNPGVRFAAAMAVARTGLCDLAGLAERLTNDRDPRVRAAAIFALDRCGANIDPTPLAGMLAHRDPRVRAQAAFLLGELGNDSAIPMLREAAAQSSTVELPQDRLFRLQVAEAMFKLGDRDAGYTIHGALYPANREEFEAAVLATQILGEVGDREAVQQLVNLVEARAGAAPGRDPRTTAAPGAPRAPYLYPPELRLAAATALAKLGYPDGVYVAEDFVAHQDPLLRAQTAFLLAQTPEPSSAQRLKTLVNDPSPLVQVAAASGLLTWLDTHADFSDVPHAAALGGR